MKIRKNAAPSIRPLGLNATPAKAAASAARAKSDGLSSFEPKNASGKKMSKAEQLKAQDQEKKNAAELTKQLDEMIMEGFMDEFKKSNAKLIQSMKENG